MAMVSLCCRLQVRALLPLASELAVRRCPQCETSSKKRDIICVNPKSRRVKTLVLASRGEC